MKLMLAETADAAVHAQGAGCSSPSSTATACWRRGPAASRGCSPATATTTGDGFPEIARAVAALPFERLVLDGEVVALDERGPPELSAAPGPGQAAPRRSTSGTRRSSTPVTYYAFDLLGFEDFDLRPLPLTGAEGSCSGRCFPPVGALRYLEHVEEEGEALYEETPAARARGHRREEGGRALQGGPLAALAQDPVAQDRRLRRRGLHRAQGLAGRLRRAAARATTWTAR